VNPNHWLRDTIALVLLCFSASFAQGKHRTTIAVSRAVQITLGPRAELGPAASPDGKWLAFEYIHPGPDVSPQIWIMDRAKGPESAKPIVDDQNHNSWPDWSLDSQWISFVSGRRLSQGNILTFQVYKVRTSDGTITQLTHFPKETVLKDSTSWSRDGRIAFVHGDSIYAVPDAGGEPAELVNLKRTLSPGSLWGAVWSPDASRLAFVGSPPGSDEANKRIWVADLKSKRIFQVTKGFTDDVPSWLDKDHILFERWASTGEVRICVVYLRTLQVTYLTSGHIDQTPAVDPTGRVLFFARAKLTPENIRAWFPETHIWSVPLRRCEAR